MDKTFNISVKSKQAKNLSKIPYVCGNTDYRVAFDFDEDWNQYPIKTARFVAADGSVYEQTVTDDRCAFPKIMDTFRVEVGVYAGDLVTTTPAVVECLRSIRSGTGETPEVPEPDRYDAMMEAINADALRAEEAAQEAEVSASEAKEAAEKAKGLGTFVVKLTKPEGQLVSSHNYDEITQAVEAGKAVVLVDQYGYVYTYSYHGKSKNNSKYWSHKFVRQEITNNTSTTMKGIWEWYYEIASDGHVGGWVATPAKTPNPYKLKLTGAVEAEYDGSGAVTVEIPEGGVDEEQLDQAVQNALQGAKDSGLFDGAPGQKGDKGDPGYTPVKGVDYFDGKDGADGQPGEKGEKGDPGEDGKDGQPGKDGAAGKPGADGADGKDGLDGYSPTVSVSKAGKTTTISITDKNGTKTATINDGEDGKDAEGGARQKITFYYDGETLTSEPSAPEIYALRGQYQDCDISFIKTTENGSSQLEKHEYALTSVKTIEDKTGVDYEVVFDFDHPHIAAMLITIEGYHVAVNGGSKSRVTKSYWTFPKPLESNEGEFLMVADGTYQFFDIEEKINSVFSLIVLFDMEGTLAPCTLEGEAIESLDFESILIGSLAGNVAQMAVLDPATMFIRFFRFSDVAEGGAKLHFEADDGTRVALYPDGTAAYAEPREVVTADYAQSYIEQTILGGAW